MKDLEAQALSKLAAMRAGKRHLKPGALPGETAPSFVWRVLTRGEKQECTAAATKRFADIGVPPELRGYQDFEDETITQVLWRAMRDADKPERPFATDARELRDLLTADELDVLWTQYADFEEEVNPDEITASPELLAEIDRILKKKDETALISFGSRSLANYLLAMGCRASNSRTGSSVSGEDSNSEPQS